MRVKQLFIISALLFFGLVQPWFKPARGSTLPPSAVPLVTSDPYLSIWSPTDELTGSSPIHWTENDHPMLAVLRVDGKVYRFLGKDKPHLESILPTSLGEAWEAEYTFDTPKEGWQNTNFKTTEKDWKTGKAAFGTAGTWSQKYNLIWDKLFGWEIFPNEAYETEMAYYLQNQYGLPLDSRRDYSKSDWILWTACLGSENDLQKLVAPVYHYATTTSSRVPLSDWRETQTGKRTGFKARSVVGGYFMKVLAQKLNN